MYSRDPDLVLLLGARTIVSLIGVLAVALGSWNSDAKDETGSNSNSTTSNKSNDNNLNQYNKEQQQISSPRSSRRLLLERVHKQPPKPEVADFQAKKRSVNSNSSSSNSDNITTINSNTDEEDGSTLLPLPVQQGANTLEGVCGDVAVLMGGGRAATDGDGEVKISTATILGNTAAAAATAATAAAAVASEVTVATTQAAASCANAATSAVAQNMPPPLQQHWNNLVQNTTTLCTKLKATTVTNSSDQAQQVTSQQQLIEPLSASCLEAPSPQQQQYMDGYHPTRNNTAATTHHFYHHRYFWPLTTFIGWLCLGLSCLLDPRNWWSVQQHSTKNRSAEWWSFLAMIGAVLLAVTQLVYQRHFVDRQHKPQHLVLTGIGIVIWGIALTLSNSVKNTLNWATPLGSLMVTFSMAILWYSRIMGGELYAKTGKPRSRPIVFNFGGPLMVWGWFWIWIGMNAVHGQPDAWYLPFYLGSRAAVAFSGAFSVLCVLWAVGYAYDEMPTMPSLLLETAAATAADNNHNSNGYSNYLYAGPGFGCLKCFCGAVWEIKLLVTASWTLMGCAAFLPNTMMDADYAIAWSFFLFVAFILEGTSLAIFYEVALRSNSPDVCRRWALNAGGTLILIALFFCCHGLFPGILSILGITSFSGGQVLLHQDRKRGKHFVETGGAQVNPHPQVYTLGSPATALGMVLLAWALSLR